MAEETKIQWATHTWNPWRGCTRVSPGCDHCYAEAMSRRNPAVLGVWGDEGTRPEGSAAYWRTPLSWDRAARKADTRERVFLGSLMDIFEDRPDLVAPRLRALSLACLTTNLDWLLLTKRTAVMRAFMEALASGPGNWRGQMYDAASEWIDGDGAFGRHTMLHFEEVHNLNLASMPDRAAWPWRSWWCGTTVEDMERARLRLPDLIATPARVRWLSCEPMLEVLDLTPWLATGQIHWVIIGGESNQGGAQARGFDLDAAESLIGQCRAAGVAVFVKQLGSTPLGLGYRLGYRHGGDLDEWPVPFRVRQFPAVA